MKRLVIAIDCDDVLIHTTEFVANIYNQLYGTHVALRSAHDSRNPEWAADRDTVLSRIAEIQHMPEYGAIKPDTNTIKVVERLSGKHELHMVTARHDEVLDVTETMIDMYFAGAFTSINHTGDSSKGDMCSALSADIMVDDSLKHLITARDCGVQWRVWFGSYPWQAGADDVTAYTSRARDWLDVEREIERIANG